MKVKCANVDEALEVFTDAAVEASLASELNEKQTLIFNALYEIKESLPLNLWEELLNEIDETINEEPWLKAIAAKYKDVFNPDFDVESLEAKKSELNGEEADPDKVAYLAKAKADFLKNDFKDVDGTLAARPLLYFRRDARQKLLETFLVDRINGKLVSPKDVALNTRQFKLRLVETIVTYLRDLGYRDDTLGDTLLFNGGTYQGILEEGSPLLKLIYKHLTLNSSFNAEHLNLAYLTYRKQAAGWEKSKKFLEAYNAKVLLENFDDLTSILLNKIVVPIGVSAGNVSNTKYELKISRATRMWGNGFGDDVSNIADIVSDVTQLLIGTTRKYNWKGEAMPDQYVSFAEFNSILTKIKDLVNTQAARDIKFDSTFYRENGNQTPLSTTSKRTLQTIAELKAEQWDFSPVSFDEVLCFISDNPQRHLHTIFDILCKTNVVKRFTNLNDHDKNLIWSLGKEIFGTWSDVDESGHPIPSRSLFDLHHNSDGDRIFEIITQMSDSIFAEKFMQFYADLEGTLKMRVLQDYEVSRVKNELLYKMRQTHGLIDTARYNQYLKNHHISVEYGNESQVSRNGYSAWNINNPNYDPKNPLSIRVIPVKAKFLKTLTIPINLGTTPLIAIKASVRGVADFVPGETMFTKDFETVWKSQEFRSFIKDTIGIDFNADVELASAYEQGFKQINSSGEATVNYSQLVYDMSRLCGTVAFNQAFNNVIVPTILSNSARERNKSNVRTLVELQYINETAPRINLETGAIEMLSDKVKDAFLAKLGLALATVHGLLSSSVVKTGEGTSVANQSLSCLRASFPYQLLTQNRSRDSATRYLTFVKNENGAFQGIFNNRELKTNAVTKPITALSAKESFKLNFLSFVGAFVPSFDSTSLNRSGTTFIAPTVNSDKPRQDYLGQLLAAYSKYQKSKKYIDMSVEDLEKELIYEFGPMYDTIVKNINNENKKIAALFNINLDGISTQPVERYSQLLTTIEKGICSDSTWVTLAELKGGQLKELITLWRGQGKSDSEIINNFFNDSNYKSLLKDLGAIKKNRIVGELHNAITQYNRTHRREPIEACEQIHYLYNKAGSLVPNETLIALWGRFNGNLVLNDLLGITALYPKDHELSSLAKGYFRYEKDLRMAEELLRDNFEVFLYGGKASSQLLELSYLRAYYPDWISKSGKMVIARRFVPEHAYAVGDSFVLTSTGFLATVVDIRVDASGNAIYSLKVEKNGEVSENEYSEFSLNRLYKSEGVETHKIENPPGSYEVIDNVETFRKYKNDPSYWNDLEIHPMLSKLNRMYYLFALLYTCSVGGAHYVYKGGGADVLEEEANRWLASNKRNVSYGSTVHKYQNKTLNGVPKWYLIAPIEDIKSSIYNIMGDLDSHKPIDGGMFVHPCFAILENNSLGGEAAGLDKKQFGTYYYAKYAAGGIVKTAGFAETNQRMLRSLAYRNLCKNMMHRTWIKEFADANGADIEEVLDITRDYNGNIINWVMDDNGCYTYYQRETEEGFRRFRLDSIEAIYTNAAGEERTFTNKVPIGWTPTNRYKIYEYPVNAQGEIDTSDQQIQDQLNGLEKLHPIQRTYGADSNGEFTINNNWDFFNIVFGGYHSLSLTNTGVLKPSENSIYQLTEALNRIGYKRDTEHNDAHFGKKKYTIEDIEEINDQDDVWQPLKYSDVCYAPNIGALKSTLMNVNPSEGMYEEHYLNAMNILMAQLGIQLDKEHHADDAEVSMPTQIILACANKGFTIEHADKLYNSLSTLTELAIEDCMEGVMEMMPGHQNKGTLLTKVATIIVDKLIQSKDDNAALEAALSELIKIRNEGKQLHPEDVVGKVAWSDAKFYNKVYSDLSSHLTNTAIKMKFPGTLAVICPTERMEQMYGDRRLNLFANPDLGLTEEAAIAQYQDEVRQGKYPKQLVYDFTRDGDNVNDKLSLASGLDTQHHYWVEYVNADGDLIVDSLGKPYRESYTMNTPLDYYNLKQYIAYGKPSGSIEIEGRELTHTGLKVARVYENVTKGRELGAFNIRFRASNSAGSHQFNIFDLASVQQMFAYNNYPKTLELAEKLLNDNLFVGPLRLKAGDLIIKLLLKNSNEVFLAFKKIGRTDLISATKQLPNEKMQKEVVEAIFKVCKVLTYKHMQDDLFSLSPDFRGSREVYLNAKPWDENIESYTVDAASIQSHAYELIMPKVYQTRFGLEELDQVQEILADPDFFSKRAINKIRTLKVSEDCFHYELKNFNGKHVYIWDSRLGEPDPSMFKEKRSFFFKGNEGLERRNLDGEFIHKISSEKDKIMQVGKLGYEVIVTDNPAFYLQNMEYNLVTFSNSTIKEDNLKNLAEELKGTTSRKAQKFLRVLIDKEGNPRDFKQLKARNKAFANLTLEKQKLKEPYGIERLRREFIQEGHELHTSFDKSLDIIAGRIPAQSLQSFMPQRVVAFDNNDINTAYVSTFLLFLQGSDLDIDAVTLLGSEFDKTGRYVMWSPLADLSSKESLAASLLIPFPTGKETTLKVNNSQDSFFTTFDDYIEELFELDTELVSLKGVPKIQYLRNEKDLPILRLKKLTPEGIRMLAEFIDQVNTIGFTIKGNTDSQGNWVNDEAERGDDSVQAEWDNVIALDEGVDQELSNSLKQLGFEKVEDALDAAELILAIINSHNLYIRTAKAETRLQMAKNCCLYEMYQICSTASNLVELMVGVDVATKVLKDEETGAVALSPYNGDDAQAAPGNYFTINQSFQEGLVGKDCVGIGAVSIKVNSTTLYYADKILWKGSDADKQRLILPKVDEWGRPSSREGKHFYTLGGFRRYGLFNLYDKNAENGPSKHRNEILQLLDSIKTEDDITPNVAMSLAAMLSVAVDNAKDLALAKINAGPKMFGLYAYGISMGMDIRDIAKIVNTPQGRVITKLCEGDITNGQMGAFSALQAIAKLEGNIYRDLMQFDIICQPEEGYNGVVTLGEFNDIQVKTASDVVRLLFEKYYTNVIKKNLPIALYENPFVQKDSQGHIDMNTKNLSNIVYQIAASGRMDECLNYVKKSPLWGEINTASAYLANGRDWNASIYLLLEYCGQYGNLVKTYYSSAIPKDPYYYAKNLRILAQGAEEMRILGTLLSSNKGLKSRTEEGVAFAKTIENAVIDRKRVLGLIEKPEDRIDFILFATDANYRREVINKYEAVKHTTNILDVIANTPHFLSYIRACAIPIAAFKMGSIKFRTREAYYDRIVADLKLSGKDKENAVRGIENAVNYRMFTEWLALEHILFTLPKGSKMFIGRNLDPVPVEQDTPIPLWTDNGLATFKRYMDTLVIPALKSNPYYSRNTFVQGLIPFELTKTGTHAAVSAYTLEGNMLPFTESLMMQMENYTADFTAMHGFKFPNSNTPGINTIANYADAFYLYSQYVFNGRKGQRSLMTLFDSETCALAKHFEQFEANLDASGDYSFNIEDLYAWCAPDGSGSNSTGQRFYLTSRNHFGKLLYLPIDEVVGVDDYGRPITQKSIAVVPGTEITGDSRLYFINPMLEKSEPLKNRYIKLEDRIEAYIGKPIVLNANNDEAINIVANYESNEYHVVPMGPLSPRSLQIVDFMEEHINDYKMYGLSLDTSEMVFTIDKYSVQALYEEAVNEVDNNCKK